MSSSGAVLRGLEHEGTLTSGLPKLVGFYFGFRSFILVLSVRLLGADPRTGTALNLAADYILVLLVAFGTLGAASLPIRETTRLASVRWAFMFLGFTGLSLAWSSTASMPVSIAYWCAMAADAAIVVLLVRCEPLTHVSRGLMKGYVCGACIVATIAWIMPAQSDLRLGDEELLGPNNIGYLCAFALLFVQYLMRNKEDGWGAPAVLLSLTVLRTLSKTTIVALLLSESYLLIADKSIKRKTKILLVFAATLAIACFLPLLTSYFEIYSNAGNQSETLSGRLGIWAYFLAEAFQHPWLGHGFDSVWNVVPVFGPDQFEAPHAHNELLQQFYAYGLAGVCMFAGIYSSVFMHIRRLDKGPLRSFFFAFLIFILARGTADTERIDLSLPMWAVILISLLIEQAMGAKKKALSLAAEPFQFPDLAGGRPNVNRERRE